MPEVEPQPLPYAYPSMAVAFTCPTCGHRNYAEPVPVEMNDEDLAAAAEQGCDTSDRRDAWIGCPDESECSKCGQQVTHLNGEGRSYSEGEWVDDG